MQYFDSNYKWGIKKTKADEIIKKKGVPGDETGGYVIEKKEPYELVE